MLRRRVRLFEGEGSSLFWPEPQFTPLHNGCSSQSWAARGREADVESIPQGKVTEGKAGMGLILCAPPLAFILAGDSSYPPLEEEAAAGC